MYGYIYLTTNLVNGKKYIGKKVADSFQKWYYGSGVLLKEALDKYGKSNFSVTVLEMLPDGSTDKQLSEREIYWIDKFNAVESDEFYNLDHGGSGWNLPEKRSKRHRESIKANHWSKSERANEIAAKISKGLTGKHLSEEHKKKISESHTNPSPEVRRRLSEAHLGKSLSEEHKSKISESLRGRARDEDVRKRISESSKGKRRITDGYSNKVINKDDPVPIGWRYGVTRFNQAL